MDECIVDGCLKGIHSRNFCTKHYLRWWRHGDPLYEKKKGHGYWTGKECFKINCNSPVASGGLCRVHASRKQKIIEKIRILRDLKRKGND